MQPTDLARVCVPGVPTLSADGRLAVVAVTRMDLDADDYRAQLWVVPTDGTATPRPLTHGWRDTEPCFSPDGAWLAFLRAERDAKPQLYVMPVDGGEPRAVTTAEQHRLGAGRPAWSPDSTRLANTARVPEEGRYTGSPDSEPPRRITTLNFRLDDIGFTVDRRPHVFVLDPFAGRPAPQRITDGDFDHADVTWSLDGGLLAFVSARHRDRDTTLTADVWVCAPDGSGLRRLTSTRTETAHPAFYGDAVVFVGTDMGADGRDFVGRPAGLWSVAVDGGTEPVRLTDPERDELNDHPVVPPVPTPQGVLVAVQRRGAVHALLVDADGPRPVLDGPRQVLGLAAAAGTVVATVADPTSPGELVVLREGAERVLTCLAADLALRVRPMDELSGSAPDGYPVHGWVVRPDGPGPHPVLLMIHGGPNTQYGWTLFDEAQVHAGAGYAVVLGNPRGSSGYGAAHAKAIRYDVGAVSARDCLALLDTALTAPDLDGSRLGVLGGSHGGYLTTWLVGHTDRFAAAVSERAVNAVDSFTASSDIGWVFSDGLYGPDAHGQSPLSTVDDIRTPVLIVHSEQDWRCPLEQAQRLYVALKARGVPTELLLFPGEGHELSRSGLPSHRVARFEALLEWWRRWL